MLIDGFRVWKGKDNYKPCKEIYKGQYMVRPVWYVKAHLDYLKSDILAIIDAFKITVEKNEDIAQECWKKSFEKMKDDDELNNMPEGSEKNKLRGERYNHEGNVCSQLERIQNNSIVISIFSYLEGYLWQICREMEICLDSKIKLKDINKNDYLQNYIDFLEKIADLDTKKIKLYFNKVNKIKFIRNRIIHNSNTIVDAKEARKLKEIEGIRFHDGFYDDHYFYVEKEFLISLLNDTKGLFESIFAELEDRIQAPILIKPEKNNLIIEPQYPKGKT